MTTTIYLYSTIKTTAVDQCAFRLTKGTWLWEKYGMGGTFLLQRYRLFALAYTNLL